MARVKRGVTTRAKHKRVLEQAKGYYGRRKNTIRIAKQAVEKAGQYAYRDRKVKKRSFRALWIQRINAAVRAPRLDKCRKRYAAVRRSVSAGSAAFAWATMTLNVAPSCIARSARTLRSSSTPASFRPCMNTP